MFLSAGNCRPVGGSTLLTNRIWAVLGQIPIVGLVKAQHYIRSIGLNIVYIECGLTEEESHDVPVDSNRFEVTKRRIYDLVQTVFST